MAEKSKRVLPTSIERFVKREKIGYVGDKLIRRKEEVGNLKSRLAATSSRSSEMKFKFEIDRQCDIVSAFKNGFFNTGYIGIGEKRWNHGTLRTWQECSRLYYAL